MAKKYWKNQSKLEWYTEIDSAISVEAVRAGCLMRIADSLENMEKPFQQLIRDREYYRQRVDALYAETKTQRKQIAAYKGIIKKKKK